MPINPATPSSPETPEALHDWLVKLQKAVRNANGCTAETDPSYGELYEDQRREAVAAVEALYNRQREEIDNLQLDRDAMSEIVASLSSQLERLTEENARLRGHK